MDQQTDQEDSFTGINIAPLVDVCLVLLLVFMVTGSAMSKKLMPVAVPKAATSQAETTENITISIGANRTYAVNEIPLNRTALEPELRRVIDHTGVRYVIIRADEMVLHGEIEDVMKMSKRAGAQRIAFATVPRS